MIPSEVSVPASTNPLAPQAAAPFLVTRNPKLNVLLHVPDLAFKQGDEFLTATRLTDESGASLDQVYHDRKEVIRQGVKLVHVRWVRLKQALERPNRGVDLADKQCNELLATQASPGLGKSAIIDAISHMSFEQVREVAPPGAPDEFCHWFVNSVHVSIDFNGRQTPKEAELEQPDAVERMMAVRVLHRYFCRSEVPYGSFAAAIGSVPELRQLTLNSAFQIMLAHRTEVLGKPAQSVFFYVDEFRCLADRFELAAVQLGRDVATFVQDHETAALIACGTVLRGNPLHTVLISTLDHRPLESFFCQSRRPILYLKLNRLDGHALFQGLAEYQKLPVRQMVAEMNGHPRGLQVLLQVLKSVAAENEQAKLSNPNFVAAELTFDYLNNAIHYQGKIITVSFQPEIFIDAVVKACLLNEAVSLRARVLADDPSSPDFASLVASGILLNSFDILDHGLVVPTMSPFVLRDYLMNDLSRLDPRVIGLLQEMLMLRSAQHPVSRTFLPPCDLTELFHARFESLRSILLDGQTKSLNDLYPECLVNPDSLRMLDLQHVVRARTVEPLNAQLRKVGALACLARQAEVVVPAKNNPGFDILLPACPGDRDALFIENRYSDIDAPTIECIGTVSRKYDFTMAACDTADADDQLAGEAILVMIAIRSVSIKPTDLPPNTLVLGPAASHKMYGPTLSCLATWFDLERRLAMVPNVVLEKAEAETAMSSKVSGRGRKAADISQGSVSAEEAQRDSKRRHVEAAASTSTQAARSAAVAAAVVDVGASVTSVGAGLVSIESMAQDVHAEPVVSREQSASRSSSRSEEVEEPESLDQSK